MENKYLQLKKEYENFIIELDNIQKQIDDLNNLGQELSCKANYVKGKMDLCAEILNESSNAK